LISKIPLLLASSRFFLCSASQAKEAKEAERRENQRFSNRYEMMVFLFKNGLMSMVKLYEMFPAYSSVLLKQCDLP